MVNNNIPLGISSAPWNGSGSVILHRESNHTYVVRYDGTVESSRGQRTFAYYAPRPQLQMAINSEDETAIIVRFSPSHLPGREDGLWAKLEPPSVYGHAWEYQLTNRRDPPVNSWLYETWHEEKRYSVYVPKVIMGINCPPPRLLVDISSVPPE
jgi:hypothetical protein